MEERKFFHIFIVSKAVERQKFYIENFFKIDILVVSRIFFRRNFTRKEPFHENNL